MNYEEAFDQAFSGNDFFLVLKGDAEAQKNNWWLPYFYETIECIQCGRDTDIRQRVWFGLFSLSDLGVHCKQCTQTEQARAMFTSN